MAGDNCNEPKPFSFPGKLRWAVEVNVRSPADIEFLRQAGFFELNDRIEELLGRHPQEEVRTLGEQCYSSGEEITSTSEKRTEQVMGSVLKVCSWEKHTYKEETVCPGQVPEKHTRRWVGSWQLVDCSYLPYPSEFGNFDTNSGS